MKAYTLAELATYLQAELRGDPQHRIMGLASLEVAGADQISFLSNPQYAGYLATSKAGAILLNPAQASDYTGNALLLKNPYLGFALLSQLFDVSRPAAGQRHPSAILAEDAEIDPSAHIGPGVVIGSGCRIQAGVVLGAHCVISANCEIGANTLFHPRVTLYHSVKVGKSCIIHSGAVLGCDGFGFAPTGGDWEKIAQLGRLIIEDQVEIGANTTIDRGALGDTVIGRDVKIDNLVQIAHNVQIGGHTAIAACTGIAGSTHIGARCMLGGGAGVAGHIEICDGVQITGMGMVTGSITEPGVYSSGTGLLPSNLWRKSAVRFRQLDEISQKVRKLEKQCSQNTDPE